MNVYRERILRARAIAVENADLPPVLHRNQDGTAKHPFRSAYMLAQLPGLGLRLDRLRPLLASGDPVARERAEADLERVKRQIYELEG